jgi:hypothetical protein
LWMHVQSCVAWQQTSHSSVFLLGKYCTESVSILLLSVFMFIKLLPGNILIKLVTLLPP